MVSYNHNIGYRSINVSLLFDMTNIGARFHVISHGFRKGWPISILHILLIPLSLCFLIPLVPLVAILFVVIYFLLVSEAIPFFAALFFPYSYHSRFAWGQTLTLSLNVCGRYRRPLTLISWHKVCWIVAIVHSYSIKQYNMFSPLHGSFLTSLRPAKTGVCQCLWIRSVASTTET